MCRPAGRVHAGGVGAMEAAHPPWDGDHRHGWATGAQQSTKELQVESSVSAALAEAVSIIWWRSEKWLLQEPRDEMQLLVIVSVCWGGGAQSAKVSASTAKRSCNTTSSSSSLKQQVFASQMTAALHNINSWL